MLSGKFISHGCWIVGLTVGFYLAPVAIDAAVCLPMPGDTPEEILRTQIITQARSPIDGKPLTAAQYTQLQVELATGPVPKLNPQIRQNIFLLRLLKLFRTFVPFLPLPK